MPCMYVIKGRDYACSQRPPNHSLASSSNGVILCGFDFLDPLEGLGRARFGVEGFRQTQGLGQSPEP